MAESAALSLYLADGYLQDARRPANGATQNRTMSDLAPVLHSGKEQVSGDKQCAGQACVQPRGEVDACKTMKERLDCPVRWGNWTAPRQTRFVRSTSTGAAYKDATLTLWLNATRPVALQSMGVALTRSEGTGEVVVYQWRYAPINPDGKMSRRADSPAPPVVLDNRSVPVTLRAVPAEVTLSRVTVPAGANVSLVFTDLVTSSWNGTHANVSASLGDITVEFGSLERASVLTAFVEPGSYSNAAVLGLFLADDQALQYTAPDAANPAYERPFPWAAPTNPANNLTIGTVRMDDQYVVHGNALLRLWVRLEHGACARPLPGAPTGVSLATSLKFETDLLVLGPRETLVVTTTTDTYSPGTPGKPSSNCNPSVQQVSVALPTAGLVLPRGSELKLQVRQIGISSPELLKPSILFGGGYTIAGEPNVWLAATGIKIPVVPSGPLFDPDESGTHRATPLLNGGAGVSRGNYSLEADPIYPRLGAGESTSIGLTLKSRNATLTLFEIKVLGLPEGHRMRLDPANGILFPRTEATSALEIAIPRSAPQAHFQVGVLANFTTEVAGNVSLTMVGPLNLTVIVDEVADESGKLARIRPPSGQPDRTVDTSGSPGRLKTISQPSRAVPGFDWLALGLAAWALVLARQSKP